MFGYASNETPELMPAPIMFAHRLGRQLTKIRKAGRRAVAAARREVAGLGDLRERQARRHLQRRHLHAARRRRLARQDRKVLHRRSHQAGAAGAHAHERHRVSDQSDRPFRRRRTAGRHRPDRPQDHRRSATAAWAVTAAARSRARIQRRSIAAPPTWAAGWRRTSWRRSSRRSAKCSLPTRSAIPIRSACTSIRSARTPWPEAKITRAINRVFDFQPAAIIEQLNLRRPIYSKTTNYGHFGKNDKDLTWEATNQGQRAARRYLIQFTLLRSLVGALHKSDRRPDKQQDRRVESWCALRELPNIA